MANVIQTVRMNAWTELLL